MRSDAVGRAYVHFALTQPHAYRLMFDLTQPSEQLYPDLVRAADRARITMTEHLRGAMPKDEFEKKGALLGHVYWASIHGVLMLHLADKLEPGIEVPELIEATMTIIGKGARA